MKIGKWNILFTKDDELAKDIQDLEGRKEIITIFAVRNDKERVAKIRDVLNGEAFISRMPKKHRKY